MSDPFAGIGDDKDPFADLNDPFADMGVSDTGYSPVRGALVDFGESALGLGDEADALARLAMGDAEGWEDAIGQSRANLEKFEKKNPTASKAITAIGIGSAFLIPGAGALKVAQTGNKVARLAGLSAVEGAAYGFASGQGEDRLTSAGIGAAAGGVLGGVLGKFAAKNADQIARMDAEDAAISGTGTHIGGDEGFRTVGKADEPTFGRRGQDTSLNERGVNDISPFAEATEGEARKGVVRQRLEAAFYGTRQWIDANVGVRAGRLVEDAELMARDYQRKIDDDFDVLMKPAFDLLEENRAMKSLLSQVGSKSAQKPARTADDALEYQVINWDDVYATAKDAGQREQLDMLRAKINDLKTVDFNVKDLDAVDDYFPRVYKGPGTDKGRTSVMDYDNPIMALKALEEDIMSARIVASRFGLKAEDIVVPKGTSRLDAVIDAVGKAAKEQGASESVAANLKNGLRTTMIASKKGGDAIGSLARKATSSALLATPFNAILNISEGVTAPIYQNGIRAWAETLPGALKSTFAEKLSIADKRWISNHEIGLDKQFMGELSAEAQKTAGELVDTASKFLYKASGVSTVNRVGQEMLTNSSIKRGIRLAKKGDVDALAKHPGARGLTRTEVETLARELAQENVQHPAVRNFGAVSLNKWQPVSATSMPKMFNDHPDGRVFYSMLSYMNKQMNSIREDIGLKLLEAQRYGLNTKRGQAAYRDAMKNGAKYTALFGVFAGIWDDGRKTLDLSNDKEMEDLLTPDGITNAALNQMASNVSSGAVNVRAQEYGGNVVEPIPAPLQAGMNIANAGVSALGGDFNPAMRTAQSYIPGISQLDKAARVGLFSPEESAKAIMQGNMPKGERLFEALGGLE